MKKTLFLSLFLASATMVFAQGTVNFANSVAFATTAPVAANGHNDRLVYGVDNTTPISGSGWLAQLYWAAGSGQAEGSLAAVDASPRTFFTGASAGKWAPVTKTFGVASGTVTLQVRVWESTFSTYENAVSGSGTTGKSVTFDYTIPATGSLPAAYYMEGLQSFTVTAVPEPSTIALGALGIGSLLFLRRRK